MEVPKFKHIYEKKCKEKYLFHTRSWLRYILLLFSKHLRCLYYIDKFILETTVSFSPDESPIDEEVTSESNDFVKLKPQPTIQDEPQNKTFDVEEHKQSGMHIINYACMKSFCLICTRLLLSEYYICFKFWL